MEVIVDWIDNTRGRIVPIHRAKICSRCIVSKDTREMNMVRQRRNPLLIPPKRTVSKSSNKVRCTAVSCRV